MRVDAVDMRGILTDSEAGYGHSIILVSSDDNSDLIVASMLNRLELCGVGPDARGGAWNLFGAIALPWQPSAEGHETHALSRFSSICSPIIHRQPRLCTPCQIRRHPALNSFHGLLPNRRSQLGVLIAFSSCLCWACTFTAQRFTSPQRLRKTSASSAVACRHCGI